MGAEQDVIVAAEERASALAVGDAHRLSGLLHGDFRWTTHVGETYTRSEYVRRNTEGHTIWRSQDLSSAEVVVVGDTAVLFAEVADVVLSAGDQAETFRMPIRRSGCGWLADGSASPVTRVHAGPEVPHGLWAELGSSLNG